MDYTKIKLLNERSTHLTKRLNRLSSWGFFKVLYRNSMGRMLATNFLMLFCCVPLVFILFMAIYSNALLLSELPYILSFTTGTGVWEGVSDFYQTAVVDEGINTALWCMLASLPLGLMFSGGFAIIRDAFWVGDLKVLKRFASGVASNIGYAMLSAIVISSIVGGIFIFVTALNGILEGWLLITLAILMSIVGMLVSIFMLILSSVSVTYKQSIAQNLSDSFRLLFLNIIPNILNFLIMLLPIVLYLLMGSTLEIIFFMFLFMVGGYYIPFVWQTHMMKTFALFHPVQVNKKGETKQPPAQPAKADI